MCALRARELFCVVVLFGAPARRVAIPNRSWGVACRLTELHVPCGHGGFSFISLWPPARRAARRGRLWGCAPFSAPLASPPKHPAGAFPFPLFHEGCAATTPGASSLRSAISLRAAQCQRALMRWRDRGGRFIMPSLAFAPNKRWMKASHWLWGRQERRLIIGERHVEVKRRVELVLQGEQSRAWSLRCGLCALRHGSFFVLLYCFGRLRGGRQGGAGYGGITNCLWSPPQIRKPGALCYITLRVLGGGGPPPQRISK